MDTEENKKNIEDNVEEVSIGIEAVLFWKGEPQSIKKLAFNLNKTEEEIKAGLEILKQKIIGRGVELIWKDNEVMLGTSAKLSSVIERLSKEELVRDLGKAGLETISIIAYRGPVSRAEIDYIRGVQSNFILRNLQIRGLVEKITNEQDHRSFLYRPTFELLQFLGVSKIEDLPEYEKVRSEFTQNLASNNLSETESQTNKINQLSESVEETPAEESFIDSISTSEDNNNSEKNI